MQEICNLKELQEQIAEIRSLRLGFVTNFFTDAQKHSLWIEKGDCYTERVENTLFIIKKSATFWNVFYCSTTIENLGNNLHAFQSKHSGIDLMYDIVGKNAQCRPFVDMFKSKGCEERASLVRMIRTAEPMVYKTDNIIRYALEEELHEISQLLHQHFDEQTEQIPYDEELKEQIMQRHVLVCEEDGAIEGLLIFDYYATTLYLRYWLTLPRHRDKKIGSRLLQKFFEEGKNTRRQLLWVIQSNENAIQRYKHYGFEEENMYDFVLKYKHKLNKKNERTDY